MKMDYKSPIEIILGDVELQVEGEIMRVCQSVGLAVDKDELIKALRYDREQYRKGFGDGLRANRWIPCSERQPEEPEFKWKGYLIQDAKVVEPYCGYWDGESWADSEGEYIEVLAWMELPKPYRKE